MSKHFEYNYREVLAEKLEKKYNHQLILLASRRKKQAQLDAAQTIIRNYFDELEGDISDTIIVSNGDISIVKGEKEIVKITMFQNYLKFTRFDHAIEVEIGEYDKITDIVEARINGNIIPSDKKCVIKKIGKVHDGSHFDGNTINYYMNEAFGKIEI